MRKDKRKYLGQYFLRNRSIDMKILRKERKFNIQDKYSQYLQCMNSYSTRKQYESRK